MGKKKKELAHFKEWHEGKEKSQPGPRLRASVALLASAKPKDRRKAWAKPSTPPMNEAATQPLLLSDSVQVFSHAG